MSFYADLKMEITTDNIKDGKIVKLPHKHFINYYEDNNLDCDGEVFWDEGLEGYCCSKCSFYTGVK